MYSEKKQPTDRCKNDDKHLGKENARRCLYDLPKSHHVARLRNSLFCLKKFAVFRANDLFSSVFFHLNLPQVSIAALEDRKSTNIFKRRVKKCRKIPPILSSTSLQSFSRSFNSEWLRPLPLLHLLPSRLTDSYSPGPSPQGSVDLWPLMGDVS